MISVVGKTVREVEKEIIRNLDGKANNPQVMINVLTKPTDNVTILGDVKGGSQVSLSPKGERILDAIASSAGVANSFNKITISLTRNGKTVDMPLETVIKDPKQNIYLNAGDVMIAMYQPWSYSVMGANGGAAREINFESTGINLVQALSRAGGLNDNMADPAGVFVFRFEDKDTYKKLSDEFNSIENASAQNNSGSSPKSWVYPMEQMDKYNKLQSIPVVYQIDFSQPGAFFSSQNFSVKNGDVIYVATASSYELSKFLRIVGLIVNPFISWGNSINKMTD
jgi:polysaccharide export outer membrane protein